MVCALHLIMAKFVIPWKLNIALNAGNSFQEMEEAQTLDVPNVKMDGSNTKEEKENVKNHPELIVMLMILLLRNGLALRKVLMVKRNV